ncbi:MAG: hypothetical protein A3E01_00250 [Gammaproteobacteria bacterium RIFCSPHIGHO2_12_FULL_63_22]|nr:MAG: hypothetical protein A3E01_00250 [Gammaproteobacteria bacterium RIFCSPHIGHO2_12_FULL_63_22]
MPAERLPGEPAAEVKHWLAEISAAKKREKDFRKDGREIIEIYSGCEAEKTPFNILYSNTETLLPALFSQTPRPVVQRRFKDEDPLGKAASLAAQRMLEYLCDTNVEGYETFDAAMEAATLDGLLPGRGVTGVKYDAETSETAVEWEQVCVDSRKWDCVYFGFARKWSKVPWIAYEEYVDQDEAKRLFGDAIAAKMKFEDEEQAEEDDEGDGKNKSDDGDEDSDRKVALVYQIWDRAGGKRVRYISPGYPDGYLKDDADPYGITGFFNCPRPLQFLAKSNDLMPTALYALYKNQAEELNNITRRIKSLVAAIKVRGAYDGSLGDQIGKILEAEDLTIQPTDDGAMIGQAGGLDRLIWLWPIDKLVAVLMQMVQQREAVKHVIYEITGVSDIVRGQSAASETLGAQKIKEAWGTMRLKRLQKATQRYARDTLRIMLEVATQKLSAATWAKATGLPFATTEQKAQAQALMQAAQMSGQQPDPKAMQIMQAPAWDDVLKLLRNDMQRAYRIDIETNSTIDVEATEDQKNISEVMQAIAQFLHGIGPLVESGTMPFGAAQAMLLTIVRRFRFGTEVEDEIKAMQAPKPKDDGGAAAAQADLQMKQMEMQQKQQEGALKAQVDQAAAAAEMQRLQLEQEMAREEHAMKMAELRAKAQLNELVTASKLKVAAATAAQKERAAEKQPEGAD